MERRAYSIIPLRKEKAEKPLRMCRCRRMAPFSIVRARSSSERTTHVVSGFDTRAHAMSREGEHAASGGDVAVIQEVRGLAEELTNLRQENTILQGNVDEVRFFALRSAHLLLPDLRPPGTDLRLLCYLIAQLKAQHTKIQTAYDSLASQYYDLTNEKNDMERFYKEQVETWRGDLELKHAQFEEARAQIMQPRELDMLRKQLMEEIETPARAKLHAYEAEIEEQTERYTQAVRDLETLRTAHDVEVARLLKDNEYQRMEHAQAASMLRKEVRAAEEALDAKTRDQESLEADVRKEADSAAEKARQSLKLHAGVTEKLERRIHMLQGDVEARDAEITRLHEKIAEREAEASTLQTRLDGAAFKHRADLKLAGAQAAKDRAELESEFAIEREEAEEKEQAILARLATHDASIKKIQDACDAKVYAAEDAARDARRAAEAGKIDAEVKLDASLTELAACKSDMLRAVGEAEGLRTALSVMERKYANEVPALRKDLEQRKKDLEHADVRVGDLKETLKRERVERVEVGASLVERDREVRRLLSKLERKDLQHANERSKSKASWQKEKLSLIARAKEIAATMEERHRESMRKAKRKIDSANRRVAAFAMVKVPLLESTAAGHVEAERREEAAGGTSMSVFEQELMSLRGRQDEYDKSVASSSGAAT